MWDIDFNSFKIRASACSKIMTSPKEVSNSDKISAKEKLIEKLNVKYNSFKSLDCKSALLCKEKIKSEHINIDDLKLKGDVILISEGHKTYLKEWAVGKIYTRQKEIINKYTTKGNINEDEGIDMVSILFNLGLLFKNENFYSNDYSQGTPDVITNEFLIDIKNSWDVFTFPIFDSVCPKKDYYWQAQVYMWLLNIRKYKLCYTLTDTPDHLIESEARRYCFQNGYDELTESIYNDFKNRMTYSDIPNELRVKTFDIERNDTDIDRIKERVLLSRKWMNQFLKPSMV